MEHLFSRNNLVAVYLEQCSNSDSRILFINELSRYLKVDSYGPNGQECPCVADAPTALDHKSSCLHYIRENYKYVICSKFLRFMTHSYIYFHSSFILEYAFILDNASIIGPLYVACILIHIIHLLLLKLCLL